MHNILLTYMPSIRTSSEKCFYGPDILLPVSRRRSAFMPHFRRGPLHCCFPLKLVAVRVIQWALLLMAKRVS